MSGGLVRRRLGVSPLLGFQLELDLSDFEHNPFAFVFVLEEVGAETEQSGDHFVAVFVKDLRRSPFYLF